jgi:hypothetical protein
VSEERLGGFLSARGELETYAFAILFLAILGLKSALNRGSKVGSIHE